jgi:hypothetical protein
VSAGYEQKLSLDEAHARLKARIVAIEFPSKSAEGARWWDSTMGEGKTAAKLAESYTRVSDKARKSIAAAIEFIGNSGANGQGGGANDRAVAAKHFDTHIKRDDTFAIFE